MDTTYSSKRTKLLFWLYSGVLAVGVALVIALLVSLGGYFIFGWESAPVEQIVGLLLYPLVPMLALRIALGWSIRRDRRNTA